MSLPPEEQLADTEARITEIVLRLDHHHTDDHTDDPAALLAELADLRRLQARLDAEILERHPELLLG